MNKFFVQILCDYSILVFTDFSIYLKIFQLHETYSQGEPLYQTTVFHKNVFAKVFVIIVLINVF